MTMIFHHFSQAFVLLTQKQILTNFATSEEIFTKFVPHKTQIMWRWSAKFYYITYIYTWDMMIKTYTTHFDIHLLRMERVVPIGRVASQISKNHSDKFIVGMYQYSKTFCGRISDF